MLFERAGEYCGLYLELCSRSSKLCFEVSPDETPPLKSKDRAGDTTAVVPEALPLSTAHFSVQRAPGLFYSF